jgi:regulator of cell morphogenesis and NO signaling
MFDRSQLVADIVLADPRTGRVFEGLRIDFCCGGRVPLADACQARSLDPDDVLVALEAATTGEPVRERDARAMSTMALVAHIIERHHAYLREVLPEVTRMAEKVSRVHGDKDAGVARLGERVGALAAALEPHLVREEEVLFPLLLAGGAARTHEELAAMHDDHLVVGGELQDIRALAGDYVVPAWACTTVRALWAALEELERDVHRHVHLENNVLMPRFAGAVSAEGVCS